jgi:hypothetical protein
MRTYDQLVSAIIAAIPKRGEIEALTEKQIDDLRKLGNGFDNALYMQTREWKEWRAANPPSGE